jgi:uncharacterized membrane protein YheB (UPF0754 family)
MKNKITKIKELVKTTFPDFSQEELKDITPQLVRQYIKNKLPENILYETAVLIPSRINCWVRIEKLCNYLKTVKYWASL